MREYQGHATGDEVVVVGGSDSRGRWTAPQACYDEDNKGWGQQRTDWATDRVGDMRGKRRPVFQDLTKLETRSPRCPEMDRNSHRGRAEIHDRVEKEGREVQIPPGEKNR